MTISTQPSAQGPRSDRFKGNFYIGPQATDADRASVKARSALNLKICIACGFPVRDDGHLPCGHDSI